MAARDGAQRAWTKLRQTPHSAGTYDPRLPTAAFDFDCTLRPYRRRGPPEELTLRFLAGLSSAFNLVIISNRGTDSAAALAPIREYVAALDAVSDGRATVYAPSARDRDRKPHTGTWEHFVGALCGGSPPGFAFYCGDAAGRPGDHSAADYMFALNAGIAFVTPEALLGGGGDPWVPAGWEAPPPAGLAPRGPAPDADLLGLDPAARNCVVMVGSPASGKTRLARRLCAQGFILVSGDVQGAHHKKAFLDAIAGGASVVVDNTNPTADIRAFFVRAASQTGHVVTICHVDTPKDMCFHLNAARCQLDPTGQTKEVPPVALHTYWKRLEAPSAAEGARVVVIPFALSADAPPEVTRFRYPLV